MFWIVVGVIYIIYMLAKESFGNSSLNGIIAVLLITAYLGSLYVLYIANVGWAILPFTSLAFALFAKINSIITIDSVDIDAHNEWLKYNEPLLTEDTSELDYSEQYHRAVRVSQIEKTIKRFNDIMDAPRFANKICDIFIPLAWGLAPICYFHSDEMLVYKNIWLWIIALAPMVVVALYIRLYMKKS